MFFHCEKSVSNLFWTTGPTRSNLTLNTHPTGSTGFWNSTTPAYLSEVYLAIGAAATPFASVQQTDFEMGAEIMTLHDAAQVL